MSTTSADITPVGPVLIAYDGSDLARLAIEQAGLQLAPGREAIIVCIWQPADVGFLPVGGQRFDADNASEVHKAAEETAAHGVSLAQAAGFNARALTVEAAPAWKGLCDTVTEHGASLVVLGSHHRGGLMGNLAGSVATHLFTHSDVSVLVVHKRS